MGKRIAVWWVIISLVLVIGEQGVGWVCRRIQPEIIEIPVVVVVDKLIEVDRIVHKDRIVEKEVIKYRPTQVEHFNVTEVGMLTLSKVGLSVGVGSNPEGIYRIEAKGRHKFGFAKGDDNKLYCIIN